MHPSAQPLHRRLFAQAVQHNIQRYQSTTQTSDAQLAQVLGLNLSTLQQKQQAADQFTGYELYQCATHFGCCLEFFYPDRSVLRADILWSFARDLPVHQWESLLERIVRQGQQNHQATSPTRSI